MTAREVSPASLPPELASGLGRLGWVRRLALRLVRDPSLADDLVQDALLAWVRASGSPRPDERPSRPRAWLASALRKLAHTHRRTDARRAQRESRAARNERVASAADATERAEELARVVRLLLALPSPYRETLLLRYVDELPIAEVARRCGVAESTVRARTTRGVALLRERLLAERRQRGGDERGAGLGAHVGLGGLLFALARPGALPRPWSALWIGVLMKLQTKAALAGAALLLAPLGWLALREPLRAIASTPDLDTAAAVVPARPEARSPEPAAPAGAPAGPDARAPEPAPAAAPVEPAPRAARVAPTAGSAWIAGRVVGRDGRGLPGARLVVAFDRDVPAPVHGTADGEGRFRLEGLPDRASVRLFAAAEGHAPAARKADVGDVGDVELAPSVRLEGRTLDAASDAPVQGVVVRAFEPFADEEGFSFERTVVTGAGGAFAFDGLPARARVELEVFRSGVAPRAEVVRLGDATTRHDVRLGPGSVVRGIAVDYETRKPLAGVSVRTGGEDGRELAVSDALGLFSFAVDTTPQGGARGGPGFRGARALGGRTIERLFLDLEAHCVSYVDVGDFAPDGAPLEVPLLASGAVEGVVLDPEGAPLPGAVLSWEQLCTRWLGDGVHAIPGRESRRAVTDAEGRFRMPRVVWEAEWAVLAVRWGARPAKLVEDAAPTRAGEVKRVEVRLGEVRRATGLVTLEGEPDAGYVYYGPPGEEPTRQVKARLDGTFELVDLEDGTWVAHACSSEGLALWSELVTFTVGPGRAPHLELEIDAALVYVEGRVTWDDGTPVVGQNVIAFPAGQFGGGLIETMGTTDADGRFRLRMNAEGAEPLAVCVFHGGSTYSEDGVEAGRDDLAFALPRLGALRLTVVTAAGGDPVARVKVGWRRADETRVRWLYSGLEVPPDESGRLNLELPVGTVDLVLAAPSAGLGQRVVAGLVLADDGAALEVRAEL